MPKQDRAAIWARVSTEDQENENQLDQLVHLAKARRLKIVERYETKVSAWKGAHTRKLNEALRSAHRGEFDVLIIWSLDRLSREGIEPTLKVLRQFKERGVRVLSLQEPWLDGSPEMQELLTAILAWAAKYESNRRSERIKMGVERRRKQGKPVGRQLGATDKKPRKKSGYYARWEREQAG